MEEVIHQNQLICELMHFVAPSHDENVQLFCHHNQEARHSLCEHQALSRFILWKPEQLRHAINQAGDKLANHAIYFQV